jgi:hypothetical protein
MGLNDKDAMWTVLDRNGDIQTVVWSSGTLLMSPKMGNVRYAIEQMIADEKWVEGSVLGPFFPAGLGDRLQAIATVETAFRDHGIVVLVAPVVPEFVEPNPPVQ